MHAFFDGGAALAAEGTQEATSAETAASTSALDGVQCLHGLDMIPPSLWHPAYAEQTYIHVHHPT